MLRTRYVEAAADICFARRTDATNLNSKTPSPRKVFLVLLTVATLTTAQLFGRPRPGGNSQDLEAVKDAMNTLADTISSSTDRLEKSLGEFMGALTQAVADATAS